MLYQTLQLRVRHVISGVRSNQRPDLATHKTGSWLLGKEVEMILTHVVIVVLVVDSMVFSRVLVTVR